MLSSHLLPDVEFTCDHVIVLDKGRIATAGADQGAEGAGRARVRGADQGRARVVHRAAAPRADGLPRDRRGRDARVRARRPRSAATSSRWPRRTACRCAICGRACRRSKMSLPRRWRVRSELESEPTAMPIHDQSYRRLQAATREHRAQRMDRDRADRHQELPAASARSSACCSSPGSRSSSASCSSTSPPTSRRRRTCSAPSTQTFRDFLEQQSFFVFLTTIYVGAGLIAQRSPRQRAADLSVEAADARRVHRRQDGDPAGVPAARHAGCRRCCC